MAINKEQLSFADMVKFGLLSKADQAEILNSKSVEEASSKINNKKSSVRLDVGTYEPKLQVSGSVVKYKTKNLFTEEFDETDVKDFMFLVEMSQSMQEEIIAGELKRKIRLMKDEGKQPLQCMVYATKNNESIFFNNDKKVSVWADTIADLVNTSQEYVLSMNHMLVNWGMWKHQIRLLVEACSHIKQSESLDEVIRDLYTDYEDDKVRFTVMKRMLYGFNAENYKSAFIMLKKSDFIGSDTDRKYFNALKRKLENSTAEEYKCLYTAFRETQGLSGAKRKRIEGLFGIVKEDDLVTLINQSEPEQKEEVLEAVHRVLYGPAKGYRDFARKSRQINQFRSEIQNMFIDKLKKTYLNLEDARSYGLAILDLDSSGMAVSVIEDKLFECSDEAMKVIYAYLLAVASDSYIDAFITRVLKYSGNNTHALLNSVRNLSRSGKNAVVRQCLYSNSVKIANSYGLDSKEFEIALRNIGEFLQGGHTVAVYDVKFDQLLYEFIGYDNKDKSFDRRYCNSRSATLVLGILENVMDKNNYPGRYMSFMQSLFNYFKNFDLNICERINDSVKRLSPDGRPFI